MRSFQNGAVFDEARNLERVDALVYERNVTRSVLNTLERKERVSSARFSDRIGALLYKKPHEGTDVSGRLEIKGRLGENSREGETQER
jgi:hypothetical protein